jgi:hypothetical protein
MPPPVHQQGQLDCLCGLYAIANGIAQATSKLEPSPSFKPRRLFQTLLKVLDRVHLLSDVMCEGMATREHNLCLRNAQAYLRKHHQLSLMIKRPWWGKARVNLNLAFERVRHHLEQSGTTAILQFETARYAHYTVIVDVVDGFLVLADSEGRKQRAIASMRYRDKNWLQKPKAMHVVSSSLVLLTVKPSRLAATSSKDNVIQK